MSITETTRRAGPYATDGSQVEFPFAFKVFKAEDVVVTRSESGIDTELALTTDYTVNLNANQDAAPGGEVVLTSAPNGPTITITSGMAATQPTVFTNAGGFFPRVLNDSLDRVTILIQQLVERLSRVPLLPLGDAPVGQFPVVLPNGKFGWSTGSGTDSGLRADLGTDAPGRGADIVAGVATTAALASPEGAGMVVKGEANLAVITPVTPQEHGAVGDMVADDSAAIAATLAASSNIVFPEATGYKIDALVTRTLTADTIIDFNGQVLSGGSMLHLKAASVGIGSLAADPSRGDTTVQLTSAGTLQKGDLLVFYSAAEPSTIFPDKKTETVRVRSVAGTTVTLSKPLKFNWSTADADFGLSAYRGVRLTTRGLKYHCQQAQGSTTPVAGLLLEGLVDVVHERPNLIGLDDGFDRENNIYRTGIQHYYCDGITIRDGDYERMSYPIGAYGCNDVRETARGRYNHHTSADLGNWSQGYEGVVNDEDSFSAWSCHAAFDYDIRGSVQNNIFLPAVRAVGASFAGVYHSVDDSASTPEFDPGAMIPGYEYLYEDADYSYGNFRLHTPNRSSPAIRQRYGRRAAFRGVEANGAVVLATVGEQAYLPGNSFGASNLPTPNVFNGVDAGAPARVDLANFLGAYLDAGVYHIDPRRRMVPHSGDMLECYGPIVSNMAGDPAEVTIRIHCNAFSGALQSDYYVGKIELLYDVIHQNNDLFSTIEKHFNFGFQAANPSLLVFPTTPVFTSDLSGQDNESAALTIGSPTFAGMTQIGSNADHYVQFVASLASGRSVPSSSLSYRLRLKRRAFA